AILKENFRGEIADRIRCNACPGDRGFRRRLSEAAARAGLFRSPGGRQDADWQVPGRQGAVRQGTGRRPLLKPTKRRRMANRLSHAALCLLAGLLVDLGAYGFAGAAHAASASEGQARSADAKVVASIETPADSTSARTAMRKPAAASARGPYYVDFRARTAASWGHAFVWYGKTSERAVEVAGLTPAGDVDRYILGYITWVPSE